MIETLLILILLATIILFCALPRKTSLRLRLVSPTFVVVVFVLFYVVLAQCFSLYYDEYYYVGRDFKDVVHLGLISALVFVVFYTVAFVATKGKINNASLLTLRNQCNSDFFYRRKLTLFSYKLIVVGYAFLFLWFFLSGMTLNLFYDYQKDLSVNSGEMSSDFLLVPFDFSIPAIVLLFTNKSSYRFVWLFIYILTCAAIGFRYRIMVVALSVFCFYGLSLKSTVKLYVSILIGSALANIYFLFVGLTRTYNKGLDFNRLNNIVDEKQVLASYFSDANIIYGLSAVIEYCTNNSLYLYFSPYIYSLIMFIPRVIWKDKPYPENFQIIIDAIGTREAVHAGTAIPIWGEFFLSFGWAGVVIGALVLGFLSKRVFARFLAVGQHRILNSADVALYCCLYGFLYVVLSRGYFAQLLPVLISVVSPLVYIKSRIERFDKN